MIARSALIALVTLAFAGPASAHVGQGLGSSLAAGFAHPWLGLDHLAAMVAVGLWSALAGGSRLWLWPAAFTGAMLIGGAIAHAGLPVPAVEPAIAASVIVLGALVATGFAAPPLLGAAMVAAFAVFHGHAHGAEAPVHGWQGYAAGFVLATALLHVIGIGVGGLFQRTIGTVPVRALGAATALIGAVVLAS